ncbi:hypothetical protein FA13DRAFT_1737106, partial [Coprinellus micaceus]
MYMCIGASRGLQFHDGLHSFCRGSYHFFYSLFHVHPRPSHRFDLGWLAVPLLLRANPSQRRTCDIYDGWWL